MSISLWHPQISGTSEWAEGILIREKTKPKHSEAAKRDNLSRCAVFEVSMRPCLLRPQRTVSMDFLVRRKVILIHMPMNASLVKRYLWKRYEKLEKREGKFTGKHRLAKTKYPSRSELRSSNSWQVVPREFRLQIPLHVTDSSRLILTLLMIEWIRKRENKKGMWRSYVHLCAGAPGVDSQRRWECFHRSFAWRGTSQVFVNRRNISNLYHCTYYSSLSFS